MVDAVLGSVIIVVATTSLALAIELSERAFRQSGYQRLTPDEVQLINDLNSRRSFPAASIFESSNPNQFR